MKTLTNLNNHPEHYALFLQRPSGIANYDRLAKLSTKILPLFIDRENTHGRLKSKYYDCHVKRWWLISHGPGTIPSSAGTARTGNTPNSRAKCHLPPSRKFSYSVVSRVFRGDFGLDECRVSRLDTLEYPYPYRVYPA